MIMNKRLFFNLIEFISKILVKLKIVFLFFYALIAALFILIGTFIKTIKALKFIKIFKILI